MGYLNNDGVLYLWQKIKTKFVAQEAGKGLSTNDYTTDEKTKLAGIEAGANKYVHPSYNSKTNGLYKITVDGSGHVSETNAVAKSDITALGIPAQDTTYGVVTTSSDGLMTSTDKTKLDGIAEGANKYSHPTYTSKTNGLYKVTVDGTGHVSATTSVAKSDITALGIPAQDTTYTTMVGATTSAAGSTGLVPQPSAGAATRYLRSDGTWQVPPDTNTTYSNATTSSSGLMSSADKTKLDGINLDLYATKSEISNVYKYKGSVASANLPTSAEVGDTYNLTDDSAYGKAGMNVAWDGKKWDALGEAFTITDITNAEIDTICV